MNVVIFGKGFGQFRQVHLSGRSAVLLCVLISTALGGLTFGAGYWYSATTGSGVSFSEVANLADVLDDQRLEIAETRQQTEDILDALVTRIGLMNARVIRLDVVGRRLTEMVDLEDGEFNFDTDLAIGVAEEELYLTGSAEAPELVTAMADLENRLDNREVQLDALESVLLDQNLSERVYPQGRPVLSGWMSSYFGRRTDPFTGKPANHRGVDFAGKVGDEIIAVADGVVTWSAERHGFGQLVEINHGNGYSTRYAHNQKNLVEVGDEIKKGQTVALMGDTGRATGPNLHFEVLKNGQRVNPVTFIRRSAD
ncbi:MAG: M23 family metallopeptidase [Pseudomonadota bacterium]|nr:M23 family metallopeptidase [Pseudomonadota bacterium]